MKRLTKVQANKLLSSFPADSVWSASHEEGWIDGNIAWKSTYSTGGKPVIITLIAKNRSKSAVYSV